MRGWRDVDIHAIRRVTRLSRNESCGLRDSGTSHIERKNMLVAPVYSKEALVALPDVLLRLK